MAIYQSTTRPMSTGSLSSSIYMSQWKSILTPTSIMLIVLGLVSARKAFNRNDNDDDSSSCGPMSTDDNEKKNTANYDQGNVVVSNVGLYFCALLRLVHHLKMYLHLTVPYQHKRTTTRGTAVEDSDENNASSIPTPIDYTVIEHDGRCDCGAISFSMTAPRTLYVLKMSHHVHSTKVDFPKAKVPIASFEISDPHDQLKKYETLRFCSRCSIPIVRTQIDNSRTHFVNVQCLQSNWIPIYVDKEHDLKFYTLPSLLEIHDENNENKSPNNNGNGVHPRAYSNSSVSSTSSLTDNTRLSTVDNSSAHTTPEQPWSLKSMKMVANRGVTGRGDIAITTSSSPLKVNRANEITECPTTDTESTISSIRSEHVHRQQQQQTRIYSEYGTNQPTLSRPSNVLPDRNQSSLVSTRNEASTTKIRSGSSSSSRSSIHRSSLQSVIVSEPSPNQLRKFMSKHLSNNSTSNDISSTSTSSMASTKSSLILGP